MLILQRIYISLFALTISTVPFLAIFQFRRRRKACKQPSKSFFFFSTVDFLCNSALIVVVVVTITALMRQQAFHQSVQLSEDNDVKQSNKHIFPNLCFATNFVMFLRKILSPAFLRLDFLFTDV